MKALLIFLFVSLTAGDKLNPAYLPPPGAKYSGGAGDNEVPFEVPEGNFGLKDESATRLTPGIFREGGITSYRPSDGKITSSTYAPICDGRVTSSTYTPSADGRIIPSTYASTADGRIIPSTYGPTADERFISSTYTPISDGRIIPSTLGLTSDRRIIPSTYLPTFNGRLPTSTYAPDSDGKITSPNYKLTSDGRIIPSTYAPTTYPTTTSNYNSYSTTSGPYGQSFDLATDGLSNRPNEENAYYPKQYSEDVNTKLPVSSENQFENDDYDTRRPVSFGSTSTANNNGGENSFINNEAISTDRYPERKARPQEEAERNAVILNNENIITPDGYFAYSFDTSNGIHADESGTASDGVKANGSYSYIGDDGKLYNVTYSADEYGFQPRGDHLPTPPPVPDAILKVIEQAVKDKDNGIFDDGSYDKRKYGFKKYQPLRDMTLGNNGPQQEPSSKPDKISQGYTSSKTDGVTLPNSQENGYYNENQKGTYVIKPNESTNQSLYEAARDYNDEYNQDSQRPGFQNTVRIPGNRIYNYNDPMDKNYNTPSSTNVDQKNRNYYDTDGLSGPKGSIVTNNQNQNENEPLENTFTETQNGYRYPKPNRQFGERIQNLPSRFDQNKNNLGYPQKTNQFTTSRPTEYYTPTTEKAKDFGANADRLEDYTNSPPTTERVGDFSTFTDRPRDYYSPSTTERFNGLDTYTDRPRDNYSPSTDGITSTERIKPTGPFTRPSDYYTPTPTIGTNEIGTYTIRPTNYRYRPTSTERINEVNSITGKPSDYSGSGGSMNQPSDYYGPTSTKETVIGRPIDYYGPSSIQRLKNFDTATGKPTYYYVPSSTDRIKAFDTATGRPIDYYSPSSTDRIKAFDTTTGRPINYYSPSSTERIKDFTTTTGRPNEYYGSSSTERIKDFGISTGRPTDYYSPSSTEIIKDFGGPNEYYGPSSTEKIKDFSTATGRPKYYGPSSTERITGEDFSGPKQPQRYDPETGYHY